MVLAFLGFLAMSQNWGERFGIDHKEPTGLIQANGRRQMIAVLQDGGTVGCSLAITINRPFLFYPESSIY
jgi:hypothetical protein